MADFTVGNRIGQADGAGDVYANLPEIWANEILASFQQASIILPLFEKSVLEGAHVKHVRVMGLGTAKHHVVGEDVRTAAGYLSNINHDTTDIFLDRPLVAVDLIDMQEMGMSGVDSELRMKTTFELGKTLAKTYDKYALQKLIITARASAVLAETTKDAEIIDADGKINAQSLFTSLATCLRVLDEQFIPKEDRMIFVNAKIKWLLFMDPTNNATMFNLDRDLGSEGSLATGAIGRFGGATFIETENIPQGVVSAITGDRNGYDGDFTKTVCIVAHKSAIQSVFRKEIKVHAEVDNFRHAWVVSAFFDKGIGLVRPEAAIEIKTS